MEIRELTKVLDIIPQDQPVLLEGIHGIGKSEFVEQYGAKNGYKVIKFFLGQMSDAGDVLGLPQRIEKEISPGIVVTVTDFCAPKWWPFNENEKTILFLDELNRAKPELFNVIMDLVLNRKIADRHLPKNTRIFAGINPLDSVYQVEEMDAAFLSRFNRYDFTPSFEEWFTWCFVNGVRSEILGFCSKNHSQIDPPDAKSYQAGMVYPNRRSWKRVSDIIKNNQEILKENNFYTLSNACIGIVGNEATSHFTKWLREENKGIGAGKILVNWDKETEMKIKELKTQDHLHLNSQIILWFNEPANEKNLDMAKISDTIAINLEYYLNCVSAEIKAEFFNSLSTAHHSKKTWPEKLFKLNRDLSTGYLQVLHGNDGVEEDN
jgi:hypothetical protein